MTISPLTFTLTSFRGIGKTTQIRIYTEDAYAELQTRDVNVNVGQPKPILEFAQSLTEVSAQSLVPYPHRGYGYRVLTPAATFLPSLWAVYNDPALPAHQTPLVTGQSYRFDRTVHLTQLYGVGDWKGRFQYSVTQHLDTYASL